MCQIRKNWEEEDVRNCDEDSTNWDCYNGYDTEYEYVPMANIKTSVSEKVRDLLYGVADGEVASSDGKSDGEVANPGNKCGECAERNFCVVPDPGDRGPPDPEGLAPGTWLPAKECVWEHKTEYSDDFEKYSGSEDEIEEEIEADPKGSKVSGSTDSGSEYSDSFEVSDSGSAEEVEEEIEVDPKGSKVSGSTDSGSEYLDSFEKDENGNPVAKL